MTHSYREMRYCTSKSTELLHTVFTFHKHCYNFSETTECLYIYRMKSSEMRHISYITKKIVAICIWKIGHISHLRNQFQSNINCFSGTKNFIPIWHISHEQNQIQFNLYCLTCTKQFQSNLVSFSCTNKSVQSDK